MLRRVAPTLRVLLLVLGLSMLFWLPLSCFFVAGLTSPWPSSGLVIYTGEGLIGAAVYKEESTMSPSGVQARLTPITWGLANNWFLPGIDHTQGSWVEQGQFTPSRLRVPSTTHIRFPLYLLAAICLAWPVTSLLLARRTRKGRGFEIEVRDQKSEVSQRAEDAASKPSDL
jgi:hypothetical protein